MLTTRPQRIEMIAALSSVEPAAWDALANPPGQPFNPFVSWDFLQALEESGCVGEDAGWIPRHLLVKDEQGGLRGAAPLYAKLHSYGEYVFDQAWADALRRAGGRYYPKLQTASPFTPAAGPRLLAHDPTVKRTLIDAALKACAELGCSSWHATFLQPCDAALLEASRLLIRHGVQFHWFNRGYRDFEAFLASLSSNRRKTIRRERREAQAGLQIRQLTGSDLTQAAWDFFFACYQDTGARKWGAPYLNRAFFRLIGERMGDSIVLITAEDAGRPIACALNFIGGDCLFGRYWGRVEERAFLHFELCYYQAIELAIALGLSRVEAGAQGEHKLARGYEPVATVSAHHILHPGLRAAVAEFLAAERPAVADEIEVLDDFTPFRKGG